MDRVRDTLQNKHIFHHFVVYADYVEILYVFRYVNPDPSNTQLKILQAALRLLRSGRDVYPTEAYVGVPGMPTKCNFAKMLNDDALVRHFTNFKTRNSILHCCFLNVF